LTASCGAEALQVWEEQKGRIDLILTDIIMPGGMTGDELATEMKRRNPDLKIIYASGYTSAFVGRDFGQDDVAFLAKPYQPQQVAQLIRDTLDTSAKDTPAPNNTTSKAAPARAGQPA